MIHPFRIFSAVLFHFGFLLHNSRVPYSLVPLLPIPMERYLQACTSILTIDLSLVVYVNISWIKYHSLVSLPWHIFILCISFLIGMSDCVGVLCILIDFMLLQFRQAKTEIVSASKVAYRFLMGVASNNSVSPESPGNSTRGSPRFQATWFKNLVSTQPKPSSSSDLENREENTTRQHQWEDAEAPLRQNSQHDMI